MPTAPQTTDELYQALQDNDRRPYGRTRTVTAESLAEAAELFAEPLPLVRALLELQEAYTYGSEPRKSPVVFARLLNLFDEQPDVFDEQLRHALFWRFKWVANALVALPEMPLPSLRQWLTEMRDRYERAGLALQPYYGQAYRLAAHTGEDTDLAFELWAGRTRTQLSDCEACEICERALYHLAADDDERALRVWQPVLDGQESCQEEPARSVSYALLPLLRTGGADRARELHLTGYRACRRNPSMSSEVGRHLEFCALTGNEARGLELLAENRNLFDDVDSPLDLLGFLTGVEVLLQRVELLGHGELPTPGYAGRTWTVSGLRAEVRDRADDLAARFDARNGTSTHTDRRRDRLGRAPLLATLELTLRTRTLDDVAPAAVPATTPAAAVAHTESPSELIARARELDEQGHPDATACWARLRVLVADPGWIHPDDPALGPPARLQADLLDDEAGLEGEKDRFAEAIALYERAASLYDEAGVPGHAVLARACTRLPAVEISEERADDDAKATALANVHTDLVRLHEETPGLAPHLEARLLRLRATVLGIRFQTSRDDEHKAPVLAETDLLLAFATQHEIAGQISGAHLLRANTHALAGDLSTATAEIDRLLDRLSANGPAWHLPRALGLRGRIQLRQKDAKAAHADLTESLRLAADWPSLTAGPARLHADLAEASMRLGRPEEALRHLTRSAELDLRHGSRTDAFCTYSNAAQLSLDAGHVEDCIALLDSLLAEPDVAAGEMDDRLVAQLRLTRARALHAGEDLKAATAELAALAAESAGWDDDPGSHAMIAAETAVLLAESGEFDRAREAADQALAAHARSPRYEQLSSSLRELARLQAEQQGAEGLAGALALLADAGRVADEARAAGYEARGRSLDSALAYERGRVNAYAHQYEDALSSLDRALALLGEPSPGKDEDTGEWAECVRLAAFVEGTYLKRPAPALTRLNEAVSRLDALGHTENIERLAALAGRLRDLEPGAAPA
ncbi:tetratricopeptide repeat protein [Streptomyces sp. NPDC051643]|uniref:tetratricopeptide repeat protein n=1 Tax=Streptomyces sp. NPDC051643 TaxID=3365665 RepID=UPI0037A6009A